VTQGTNEVKGILPYVRRPDFKEASAIFPILDMAVVEGVSPHKIGHSEGFETPESRLDKF
jgi:hypothetical protein